MILSLKNSGLAILFDRSGGKITPEMAEVIDEAELKDNHGKRSWSKIVLPYEITEFSEKIINLLHMFKKTLRKPFIGF